jgi:alkylation response protein AidB-like acyl-CoA dehydrogenase
MLVEAEKANTAMLYAAWAEATGVSDAPLAAAMAKAIASDAYGLVTAAAIQIHGGIGFTWEHDLHLYFRRAMASASMFGDAGWNRELAAQRLGL